MVLQTKISIPGQLTSQAAQDDVLPECVDKTAPWTELKLSGIPMWFTGSLVRTVVLFFTV